jgi:pyruvate/2-oxoglutarate dehydrogenase complex dihydrolipoamide dehydrogenase (E3) component
MRSGGARAAGIEYETGRSSFGLNAKARSTGFADGLIELIFRVSDRVVLGVDIVGELASELANLAVRDARERDTGSLHRGDLRRPHPERSVHVRGLRRTRAPRPETAHGSCGAR